MLHAVAHPVLASLLAATTLASVGIGAELATDRGKATLTLHAPRQCGAFYLTAWEKGPISVDLPDGALQPLKFEIRAKLNDGCRWRAVETLVPKSDNSYAYSYDEYIESCDRGAQPFLKTPRKGTVVVDR